MIIKYRDLIYECASVEKKDNEILIHSGIFEDDEEIIYQICGCIDFSEVEMDGGSWTSAPTQLDIIEAQVAYTAMMTDTLLEE